MKELSESEIKKIIEGNSENLNLEFKSTFDFTLDIWARERFIRSILAMSNTRNGGYIVIGITEDEDGAPLFLGVQDTHLKIFKSKVEDLKSKVESFASSPVSYEIGLAEYNEKSFIIISIAEFSLNPVICKNGGKDPTKQLEEGSIYIRALKDKPSSIKLTNPIDIQDFLERVVDKHILSLHRRGWKHDVESLDKSKISFEKERGDF